MADDARDRILVASRLARLTHPDRIIDALSGLRKLNLARYYAKAAPLLLKHLRGRPVAFVRAPTGIAGGTFFQRHPGGHAMPGVNPLPQHLYPGHPPLMEIATLEGIMACVQMNVVEFHTWNVSRTAIGRPDRMVFDLDPGRGVQWGQVCQAADMVRAFLAEFGLTSWLKTSGGRGLHIIVPLIDRHGLDIVSVLSRGMAQRLARTAPGVFAAQSGDRHRVGRVFADYLRNGQAATTVAAWSARARPGLGVSVPVAWDEVSALRGGDHWSVATAGTRLNVGDTPWRDYAPQSLDKVLKAFGPALRMMMKD